jgi:hypothetical protein
VGKTNFDTIIQQYRKHRTERKALEERVKELRAVENEMKLMILQGLEEQGISSAGGEDFLVFRTRRAMVDVKDWNTFHRHIMATGDLDLLQRRPAIRAIADREDNSESVPGVKVGHYFDLSVRSKGAK